MRTDGQIDMTKRNSCFSQYGNAAKKSSLLLHLLLQFTCTSQSFRLIEDDSFLSFFPFDVAKILLVLFLTVVRDLRDHDFYGNSSDAPQILFFSYYCRTSRVTGKYLLNNSPAVHRK
jgi:hypothetical protein